MYKTWKDVQLTFLDELKNLGKLDDYIQNEKNWIEIKWVWLCKVSKLIDRFVVRLKAIKY